MNHLGCRAHVPVLATATVAVACALLLLLGGCEANCKVCLGRDSCSQQQKGQDSWVLASAAAPAAGDPSFFLDLAASEACVGSDTVVLERNHGWKGICVDANPKFLKQLRAERPGCQVVEAAVSDVADQRLTFVLDDGTGGLVGEKFDHRPGEPDGTTSKSTTFQVTTRRLDSILEEQNAPRRIQYLSLDLEGAESAAMPDDFPWDTYIFELVTIERPPPDLNARLFGHGYLFVKNLWHDSFYHESHPRAAALQHNGTFQQLGGKCLREAGTLFSEAAKLLGASSGGTGTDFSFDAVDEKYRHLLPKRHLTPSMTILHGNPPNSPGCPNDFGCCEFPGFPQNTTLYGEASTAN